MYDGQFFHNLGAPLKIHKLDAPGGGPGWDGSLNDPLNGEKGMLSEGGMHVPFVIAWPETIPAEQVYDHPVSALDVAATAAALARLETKSGDFDGTNLIPHLTGETTEPPHKVLTWRWTAQSAIRAGNWKLLRGGDREYLYDLDADIEEKHNLAAKHPEVATRLRQKLSTWANELDPPGLANGGMSSAASDYFDFYLDGKPPTRTRVKSPVRPSATRPLPSRNQNSPWLVRNGNMTQTDDGFRISSTETKAKQQPFLTRNGINLAGPIAVELDVKTSSQGPITISWRTNGQAAFSAANRFNIEVTKVGQWQNVTGLIESSSNIVHVRVKFPGNVTLLKALRLKPSTGDSLRLHN